MTTEHCGVQIQEHTCKSGKIGHITLDVPKTLNSLTLDMVNAMQRALDAWVENPDIALVLIDGAGQKAFCAGGDVQALRESSIGTPGGPCVYAETFFANEYRMNFTLHTYPKPILCWGGGIVMGGGLGILAGCTLRVVTESTRIAMPEVTIALFPDVGGSWFLNRMPGRTGLFLGITGASINAGDALYTGLGNRFLNDAQRESVFEALIAQAWGCNAGADGDALRELIAGFAEDVATAAPESLVARHRALIDALCDADQILTVIARIRAQVDSDDPWLAKAAKGLAQGSPLAVLWIARQLDETRHCSLAEVFQAEVQLGTNIMRHPEFAEGVRALLVDKDRQPKWLYSAPEAVPGEVLDLFFTAPWSVNPLADLSR